LFETQAREGKEGRGRRPQLYYLLLFLGGKGEEKKRRKKRHGGNNFKCLSPFLPDFTAAEEKRGEDAG